MFYRVTILYTSKYVRLIKTKGRLKSCFQQKKGKMGANAMCDCRLDPFAIKVTQ